jgi:hypothetical protein
LRRISLTAICRFRRPMRRPRPSPGISRCSSVTRSRKSGCPSRCCRCSRASATCRTRCWAAWSTVRSKT